MARVNVEIGGPTVVVAPNGEILLETTAQVAIATIDRGTVRHARTTYPGYLAIRADLYSRSWREVERTAATRREIADEIEKRDFDS